MAAVYLYVHDLRSSGVVRNAITFAARHAADHPTTLIAGYADGFFRDEAARGPFALKTLSDKAGGRLTAAWRLRRWLRTQPPGVLISHGNMGHATPYLACRGLRHIRRVYCVSNEIRRGDGLRGRLRRLWMDLLARDAARLVLVGRTLREAEPFAGALRSGLAVEIANGVDLARATALSAAPAPHPWLDEAVPVVLGIGRLRPQKNFDLLIEAVARARAGRRMRLVIIGGGTAAERERLTLLAAHAGLGDDFRLAGETDNVFAWLARAAVFALPSRWEGSSLVLLEALASGIPVVASRLAGDAAMVLDEGRYGLLFDGRDAGAVAAALLRQSSADAVRPGARARDYAMAVTAGRYADLAEQVLRTMESAAGEPSRGPAASVRPSRPIA